MADSTVDSVGKWERATDYRKLIGHLYIKEVLIKGAQKDAGKGEKICLDD